MCTNSRTTQGSVDHSITRQGCFNKQQNQSGKHGPAAKEPREVWSISITRQDCLDQQQNKSGQCGPGEEHVMEVWIQQQHMTGQCKRDFLLLKNPLYVLRKPQNKLCVLSQLQICKTIPKVSQKYAVLSVLSVL